ncbi:MAG: hypothetical protein HY287_09485 [Planctomycetes bacterium]|nr:hypothetical protein [Planctomycetota bacterium]MBI3834544.1 hypothetical protein [Planctomycetota bacterium]
MKRPHRGFTLIDLLAFVAAGAILITIGTPTMFRARELSKRMVCCQNLAGLGVTAKIYAAQNGGSWMVPGFKNSLIDGHGIDYTNDYLSSSSDDPGSVGFDRQVESYSETTLQPSGGSYAVSTTRAWWLLVRSGNVRVQQFICPSSGDDPDPTQDVDRFYDFLRYRAISYGYQVPFGPPDTRPREGANARQIFAADKGPFYVSGNPPTWTTNGQTVLLESAPFAWQRFNSPNHGGGGIREGQNCQPDSLFDSGY